MKHREKMASDKITPFSERAIVSGFNLINAKPLLWDMSIKVGATVASGLIRDGKMPLSVGAIKQWNESRDLPAPDGQSFRSWFANRKQK